MLGAASSKIPRKMRQPVDPQAQNYSYAATLAYVEAGVPAALLQTRDWTAETLMQQLPATTKHGADLARLSVPTCLAAVAAMFPDWAPTVALATPLAVSVTEHLIARPTRILEDALRHGEVVDLSSEQVASFLPMGYRFLLAARQGEYKHNLKLLAALLTAELKAETCQPGDFLDMARRVEGLNITALRAVALIGEWLERPAKQGSGEQRKVFTAPLLANTEIFGSALEPAEAADALADLTSRAFLFTTEGGAGAGYDPFYAPTRPLRSLIARALDVAQAEAYHHSSTNDDEAL